MFKDHIPNELKLESVTQNVQSRSSLKKFHEILKQSTLAKRSKEGQETARDY